MDQEQARKRITDWARENYGHFIEVREVTPVRRATGRVWAGKLYCTIQEGDVQVGKTVVSDAGNIIEQMDVDKLVDALVAVRTVDESGLTTGGANDFGGLADDMDFSSLGDEGDSLGGLEPADSLDSVFESIDPQALQRRANQLIATGEQEKLLEARNILPQLLSDQERRGQVLQQMAELEMLLGEVDMGIRHLEASAREYADLANLDGLAVVAELASQIMSDEQFAVSGIKSLFDQTRNKLRPLENLNEAPLFVGIGATELAALEQIAEPIQVERTDVVLKEGAPANTAFIIKTGTLSVRLESTDGSSKVVRSCFPGDFIGESSVLGPPGATCTATVQGEMTSDLWQFDGTKLRGLCTEYPEMKMRIESAKTLHQLDSFISMNESTSSLDVSMRDQLLASISGLGRVARGTVLNPPGEVPKNVHLIVNGTIVYKVGNQVVRTYEADTFAGLRDALHELPIEGEFVADRDCLLVYMDPERLRAIAQGASPEVIAVLEKLE
ncbi:MAG: cyclic nucleotide-binding domain-containing protein [Deltaproteobacteria bacterium]|nr:cyclic nucleotide-binding domain-containing protein [Deltaproteobacteria bacterium]